MDKLVAVFYEYNDLGYITLAWDQRWDNSARK